MSFTLARLAHNSSLAEPISVASYQSAQREQLLAFAKTLEGHSYHPGGCSEENGFDCSGLVKYVHDEIGVPIGRSSRDQALAGKSVVLAKAEAGDVIVFSRKSTGKVFHAGILLHLSPDSTIMLHATERRGVHRTHLEKSTYWKAKIADVRQVLQDS